MHPIVRTPASSKLILAISFALVALSSPASASADQSPAPLVVSTPWPGPGPSTEPSALTPLQRLSIERGAADLGGASEQALLSATLYVSSAATLVGGIATLVVLFTELAPWPDLHSSGWGAAEFGALGAALLCFAAHAITTPLAIVVGRDAQQRHERARRALLLVDAVVTPIGATLVGRF